MVVMALDILEAGGARNLRLEINSLGCPDCRGPFREELREFLLARKERLCEDCQRRAERNPLRALDCKKEPCRAEYREAPELTNFLCEGCRAHYEAFKAHLSEAEVSYRINPRLVRGLDYYTRTIFEIKAEGLGAQDTVAAGGRYDGLVSALGGPDTPAVGFAIGMERWLLVSELPAELESPPEIFIAPLGEEALRMALGLSRTLRAKGVRVEADYEGRRLKALLRQADRLSAQKVLILGEDELRKKEALLKDLRTGAQESLPFEDLTDLANRILIDLRF